MGMQKKALVLFAAIFVLIGLTAQTMAYVPDGLDVSAQPATIDADGESTTDITAQVMADLDDDGVYDDVVKMCGIEVTCESQDPDVLHNGEGGATLTSTTDPYGKIKFTFVSTGNESYNEGDVDVICRALQLEEGRTTVHVWTGAATQFHVSKCPDSGSNLSSIYGVRKPNSSEADIVADGSSHVYITAQLKNDRLNPVHRSGKIIFKSMNTVFVKTCGPVDGVNDFGYSQRILDSGRVAVTADQYGIAIAEFCSAGSGSENVGVAEIHVEADPEDLPNVADGKIYVGTTNQFGTTYKDGFLAMSAIPMQIMANRESCVWICAQTRDQDKRIIKKSEWQVLLESEDTSLLYAFPWASETDHGLALPMTNLEGIALHQYCSAGKFDPNNVGLVKVRGDLPTSVEEAHVMVDLRTEQIWPVALETTATMPMVDCDGVSKVTVTAQLLDKYGLATGLENRLITFKSSDTTKLKNLRTGGAIIDAYTDKEGKAHATFITTDCKDGGNSGDVDVKASTQSPARDNTSIVTVVKPLGFVPDGVSVYTDQNILGHSESNPSHAKPFLISADGMEKTYVTAQVCEMVHQDDDCNSSYTDKAACEAAGDVKGRPYCVWNISGNEECKMDPNYVEFCNPVKRCGVEIEFKVRDNTVVQNRGDNPDPSKENDIDYVKLYTDYEGKATAVFTSSGDAPVNKEHCTLIQVDAKNGELLGAAYSEVCTRGQEGTHPNAIWVWADPAYITADGESNTTLRAALYECYGGFDIGSFDPKSLDQVINYSFLNDTCKPVHVPGITIKFETTNTDALESDTGGYLIYSTTNEFGQADATFYSVGYDKQHMDPAEIEVWTVGSGENVVQLNYLEVKPEEKTWPWCPLASLTGAAAVADLDGNQYITDSELIQYILDQWMDSSSQYYMEELPLISVVQAWIDARF